MYYGSAYRLQIVNVEGQQVTCTIYDTATASVDPIGTWYTDLEGAESPLVLSTIDNDEDKFSPIRAKQLQINFKATNNIHLSTFTTGADDRWLVELTIGPNGSEQLIFKGNLVMEGNTMPFQPPENSEVTLMATDNLGTLKSIELTKFDGTMLKGYYSLKDIVTYCLYKTGLDLEICIAYNLYEESFTLREANGCPLAQLYIDDRTFEDRIGTHQDCYQVLEQILSDLKATLFQHNGQWWIIRQAELFGASLAYKRYFPDGTVHSNSLGEQYYKEIQKITGDETILSGKLFWSDENAEIGLLRPIKRVKDTHPFNLPQEIIRNQDFSRGDIYFPLSMPDKVSYYHIDDWTLAKPLGGTPVPTSATAYIRRAFEDQNKTYENERYIVITQSLSSGGLNHIYTNERIPLLKNDKFDFSVDTRMSEDQSGTGNFTATIGMIRLYTTTGEYYSLDINGGWNRTSAAFLGAGAHTIDWVGKLEDNQGQWTTISVTADPLPEDGDVEVILTQNGLWGMGADTHFTNLRFDYKPWLNGAYSKYKGWSNTVLQSGNYKSNRDSEVTLTNSARRLFKGSLHKYNGTAYVMVGNFKDRTQNYSGGLGLEKWGKWQAFHEWQNYRNSVVSISGTLQGIQSNTSPTDMPDLIHRFTLLDNSPYTNTKYFQLLHYEMDLHLCELRSVMVQEIMDYTKGYDWTSEFQFRWEN